MGYVQGADYSLWQDDNSTAQKVNFDKAYSNGLSFCMIKASQRDYADEDILYNWKSSKEAGLARGAYHFFVWDYPPESQADFFWNVIRSDPGELPPTVDFEWWSTTPSDAISLLKRFLERFKKISGKIPMIYTAPGFWMQYGSTDTYWMQYYLWIAHWRVQQPIIPKPWNKWTFWQYTNTGDGHLYGAESNALDMDYFNGDKNDLYEFIGWKPEPSIFDRVSCLENWAETLGFTKCP